MVVSTGGWQDWLDGATRRLQINVKVLEENSRKILREHYRRKVEKIQYLQAPAHGPRKKDGVQPNLPKTCVKSKQFSLNYFQIKKKCPAGFAFGSHAGQE